MGGVARRATQIDRARAEADAVLVLDAGNLFLPSRPRTEGRPPPDPGEVERRGRLLAAAFARTGTTAVAPGERDLALGLPVLRRLAQQAKLPIVSANLRGRDGKLLFEADRLVDAAGVKIGVFSVTVPPSMQDAATWRAGGIEAGDAAAAARDEVTSLRARGAALVVALLQVGGGPDNRRLLEAVPGIDWAVTGGSGLRLESPERAGGAWMLGTMADGKELGRLDLHVIGGSVAFTDRGERAELETILADHRRQLVDYDRRLGETDPASLRDYYETRRHEIEKAIARESALLARLPRAITGSWFENRLLPLDADTPDQNGVAILVDAYNRESVRRAARGKPVGVGTDASPDPSPRTPRPARRSRATPARPPAPPVTPPRSPSGRRRSTRARWPRWPGSGAIAIPPASGATSPATFERAERGTSRRRGPASRTSDARPATGRDGRTWRRPTRRRQRAQGIGLRRGVAVGLPRMPHRGRDGRGVRRPPVHGGHPRPRVMERLRGRWRPAPALLYSRREMAPIVWLSTLAALWLVGPVPASPGVGTAPPAVAAPGNYEALAQGGGANARRGHPARALRRPLRRREARSRSGALSGGARVTCAGRCPSRRSRSAATIPPPSPSRTTTPGSRATTSRSPAASPAPSRSPWDAGERPAS